MLRLERCDHLLPNTHKAAKPPDSKLELKEQHKPIESKHEQTEKNKIVQSAENKAVKVERVIENVNESEEKVNKSTENVNKAVTVKKDAGTDEKPVIVNTKPESEEEKEENALTLAQQNPKSFNSEVPEKYRDIIKKSLVVNLTRFQNIEQELNTPEKVAKELEM